MNRLEEIEAYLAVVDFQGFGKAAERLGIAKSKVSRRVSELERRLGFGAARDLVQPLAVHHEERVGVVRGQLADRLAEVGA